MSASDASVRLRRERLGWRRRRAMSLSSAWVVALLAIIATLFPIYWIIGLSMKTPQEAFSTPPSFLFPPSLGAYGEVLKTAGFTQSLINSLIAVGVGVVLTLLLATPAAYALSRLRVRWRGPIGAWLVLAYILPDFLFVIPMYVLYQNIGLYDTAIGLSLIYQVVALPLAVWLLKAFFDELPGELGDAAEVDGCTQRQILTKIYLPLVAPGVATTAILVAIYMWNELTMALALTFDAGQTAPVAVAGFRGYAAIKWDQMAAAAVIILIPMIVLAFAVQRYIVRGLTFGAVK